MLEKQKLTSWFQDPANPSNGICHSRNRAQRKRADDRVYTDIGQRDSLSRQVEKFDIELRPSTLVLGPRDHPWIRFERVDFAHF